MRPISLFILLLLISFHTKGQEKVWKKQVSRVIDIRGEHSRKNSIGKAIFDAVRSGKAIVYDPVYFSFPEKMSDYAVKDLVNGHTETFTLVDPIDGHEVKKVQTTRIQPESIYMCRVMEEWTFNPATGKISIQIKYIAPMEDIMGDDAIFRGRRLLFWISFKDFSDALHKSKNAKKQVRLFYNSLWQSYFQSFPIKKNNEQWEGYAKSIINLSEPEDTVEHFLRDENEDTSLSMQIANEFEKGKLPIWSYEGPLFSRQLTKPEFTNLMYPVFDTQTLVDPVDNHEVTKLTKKNILYLVSYYYILQHWALNPKTGKTDIVISGIAPVLGNFYERETLFRVRYSDLQPLLNRVEQYHPTNTFAMHIWDSYFLSDRKPVLVNNN